MVFGGQCGVFATVFLADVAQGKIENGVMVAAVRKLDGQLVTCLNLIRSFGRSAVDFNQTAIAKFFGQGAPFDDPGLIQELVETHLDAAHFEVDTILHLIHDLIDHLGGFLSAGIFL